MASSASADGDFGTITENAVKRFQQSNNLTVDGKAGPNTLTALVSMVKKVQNDINRKEIQVDGIYGSGTKAAVTDIQKKSNCLKADGIAGENTRYYLAYNLGAN